MRNASALSPEQLLSRGRVKLQSLEPDCKNVWWQCVRLIKTVKLGFQ